MYLMGMLPCLVSGRYTPPSVATLGKKVRGRVTEAALRQMIIFACNTLCITHMAKIFFPLRSHVIGQGFRSSRVSDGLLLQYRCRQSEMLDTSVYAKRRFSCFYVASMCQGIQDGVDERLSLPILITYDKATDGPAFSIVSAMYCHTQRINAHYTDNGFVGFQKNNPGSLCLTAS